MNIMRYEYARVNTKGQLEGNSIEEQITVIKNIYSDAEIITESYFGEKERPLIGVLSMILWEGQIAMPMDGRVWIQSC